MLQEEREGSRAHGAYKLQGGVQAQVFCNSWRNNTSPWKILTECYWANWVPEVRRGYLVSVLSGNHTNHINIEENETAIGSIWLSTLLYLSQVHVCRSLSHQFWKEELTSSILLHSTNAQRMHLLKSMSWIWKKDPPYDHSANIRCSIFVKIYDMNLKKRKKRVQVLHMTTVVLHN
jgi:hypothetical protein